MALADANGPPVQVFSSPSRHFLYRIMQISLPDYADQPCHFSSADQGILFGARSPL
jgi:hypothetical protein